MKRLPSPLKFGGIFLLFLIGFAFRGLVLPAISADMRWAYIPWYDVLKNHGIQAIGTNFSDYSPPFLYLLWLGTFAPAYVPSVAAIKSITILADIVNTFLVYRIVKLRYPAGLKPILAGALFWVLPTVITNSSLWGQTDSLYTLFLLVCLYYLLTDRPFWGMTAFGVAVTIKAQAVFIAPLLAMLFLRKRIAWQHFFMVPLVYIILDMPAYLLGRPLLGIFTIYSSQAAIFQDLSRHAPNLYIFMNSLPHGPGVALGLAIAAIALSCWIWFSAHSKSGLDPDGILFMSLVSVALTPFLLPKMLDRYFYPADVLSLVAAFYFPELWFIPILYQLISGSAYFVSLFDAPLLLIKIAALINTAVICFLCWRQFRAPTSSGQASAKESLT